MHAPVCSEFKKRQKAAQKAVEAAEKAVSIVSLLEPPFNLLSTLTDPWQRTRSSSWQSWINCLVTPCQEAAQARPPLGHHTVRIPTLLR
jgi:hypothetical protein